MSRSKVHVPFRARCYYCNHKKRLVKPRLIGQRGILNTTNYLRPLGENTMNFLIKLMSLGVSLAAGAAARKALAVGWKKGTGHEPPKEADDLENPLPGVLVFALVTAATGAVIQVVTQRLAQKAKLRLDRNPEKV